MNKKLKRRKRIFKNAKFSNFKYETLAAIFGYKVDEFSLIYCQDWFCDPSPEFYGKDIILWSQIPLKYLKIPKNVGDYTFWLGWITFKDTQKWLYRDTDENGVERWIWREGDRPSLNNDTTMEIIEIDA